MDVRSTFDKQTDLSNISNAQMQSRKTRIACNIHIRAGIDERLHRVKASESRSKHQRGLSPRVGDVRAVLLHETAKDRQFIVSNCRIEGVRGRLNRESQRCHQEKGRSEHWSGILLAGKYLPSARRQQGN